MAEENFLTTIRERARRRILFLPHAVRQMSRPERMITPREVRTVIEEGELIEDYPEDARGHSALLLGWTGADRPLHVICAPKDDYLAIITSYLPSAEEWSDDYRKRSTP